MKPRQPSGPIPKELLAPTQPKHSTLEIFEFLDTLPLKACLELARSLLTYVANLPSVPSSSRAMLKRTVLFLDEYGSTAQKWSKAMRLACWNADVVSARKQQLDNFLGQYGIDICMLTETHLRTCEDYRLAKYVCPRNILLIEGGGIATLVRRGIDHHTLLLLRIQHLEHNSGKPVKILAVYL